MAAYPDPAGACGGLAGQLARWAYRYGAIRRQVVRGGLVAYVAFTLVEVRPQPLCELLDAAGLRYCVVRTRARRRWSYSRGRRYRLRQSWRPRVHVCVQGASARALLRAVIPVGRASFDRAAVAVLRYWERQEFRKQLAQRG